MKKQGVPEKYLVELAAKDYKKEGFFQKFFQFHFNILFTNFKKNSFDGRKKERISRGCSREEIRNNFEKENQKRIIFYFVNEIILF